MKTTKFRSMLTSLLLGMVTTVAVLGCGNLASQPPSILPAKAAAQAAAKTGKSVVVYFSLHGNDKNPADIDASTAASVLIHDSKHLGTTQYMAQQVARLTGSDLQSIEVTDVYPAGFQDVIDKNHEEMHRDAFPSLKTTPDISGYDTVYIGYPVWATTIPRPVATFIRDNDFRGKTVIPFCTHDGYNSGSSYRDIGSLATGAVMKPGLAVEAHDVAGSEGTIKKWLGI